ncbi:MAG: outer membrane lipoprotein-sorting protein [Treponema sp.]|nr:outer membrane lipoprotein-sorting protein [Treponema sp.]
MKKIKVLSIFAGLFLMTNLLSAQSAEEIMKKSKTLPCPEYSIGTLIMDIIDKNGTVLEHRILNEIGDEKESLRHVVFDFRSPASVKDTRILQAEKMGRDDEKWIFLPSLKTTRRIANAERSKSFVGSEFTYNDMTVRKFEDDAYEMLDENVTMDIGGKSERLWKIKETPVAKKNVEYTYLIRYIDKVSYLPLLEEYYDKNGKLIKLRSITKHEEVTSESGKKYWLRRENIMENKVTGRTTRVAVDKMTFDKPISERYFTQNWLNTGK